MRTWITAAALGAAILGGPGAAGAQTPVAGEVPPPPPPPGGPLLRADANGDGVVTRAEVEAEADRRFAAMDANGDGKIDRDERRAFHARERAERPTPPPPVAPPPPASADAPGVVPPPPGAHPGERRHDRHPRPRDETQAQFRERALRTFDRADTNRDGTVDAREREAMALLARARRVGHDDRRAPPAPPPGADARPPAPPAD